MHLLCIIIGTLTKSSTVFTAGGSEMGMFEQATKPQRCFARIAVKCINDSCSMYLMYV